VSTEAQETDRLLFIDLLRGLAVVLMVLLHTSHGWLLPSARVGPVWEAVQFFGGLAAPMFLMLTGTGLGLQWGRANARGSLPAYDKHIARALQLVILGYVLRLQMWMIDAGGYTHALNYVIMACLGGAYALTHAAVAKWPADSRRALSWLAIAMTAWLIGIVLVRTYEPQRLRGLLRIDILQCIGASLCSLSLLAKARKKPLSPSVLCTLALGVGLVTTCLNERIPSSLPAALTGYIAQGLRADGTPVYALFPLFPWFGYVAVGTALGLHYTRAATPEATHARLIATAALGAWLALLTCEYGSVAHAFVHSHEWLRPLLRLVYKAGLVMLLTAAALLLTRSPNSIRGPLQTLGQASLLIYWVHLEFAFGSAGHFFLRRLNMPLWLVLSSALLVAMWSLASLRPSPAPLVRAAVAAACDRIARFTLT